MNQLSQSLKQLSIVTVLAGSALISGCASQGSSGPGADANMQTFNQYVDGWRQRSGEAIAKSMSSTGTYSAPGVGDNLDQKSFIGYTQALFTAIPDFTVKEAEAYVVDGNTIGEKWVVTGTWTGPWSAGPLAGMQPTGKSFVLPGSAFIDFKDGKIDKVVQYYDNLTLFTQIGAINSK